MALACHCVLNRQKSLQGRLELALAMQYQYIWLSYDFILLLTIPQPYFTLL